MMKTALITGGLRGIGYGISKALLAENFSLALCGTRSKDAVNKPLDELKNSAAECPVIKYYPCDIGNRDDRTRLVAALRKDFSSINVLVNNAGAAPKERRDLFDMREDDYEQLMKVNLQGPFFLTQQIAKWMIENTENHHLIINLSSISADTVSINRGEYCISKAGVSMATQLWAVRLAEYGIPVYEIRPGIIHSDMTAGVTEKYSKLIADGLVPLKRWGEPEDIGKAAAMLARGDLPYSTGQVINLDGGQHIPRL